MPKNLIWIFLSLFNLCYQSIPWVGYLTYVEALDVVTVFIIACLGIVLSVLFLFFLFMASIKNNSPRGTALFWAFIQLLCLGNSMWFVYVFLFPTLDSMQNNTF
jgi:hypothetical protein